MIYIYEYFRSMYTASIVKLSFFVEVTLDFNQFSSQGGLELMN